MPINTNANATISKQLGDLFSLPDLVREAVNIYVFENEDELVWVNSLSGKVSGNEVYEAILPCNNGLRLKSLRLDHILPSLFTLLWRLLHGKFTYDDML